MSNFILNENNQAGSVTGFKPMGFIHGPHDTLYVTMANNATIDLKGNYETISQYGGNAAMTITGFNGTDHLSVYDLWMGANNHP